MTELLILFLFSGDVKALGSDSFKERQAASARLERWAWLAWRLCDRDFRDPEVRRRAAAVVRKGAGLADCPAVGALATAGERRHWAWDQNGNLQPRDLWRPRLGWEWDFQARRYHLATIDLPWWLARLVDRPGRPPGSRDFETWPLAQQREASRRIALALQRIGVPRLAVLAAAQLMLMRERSWRYREKSDDWVIYPDS